MDNGFNWQKDFNAVKKTTPQAPQSQQEVPDSGNWIDDLQVMANQIGGVTYPSSSLSDQIAAMPNSEKLTGMERWLYKKLPGFSQSNIGQALEWFGKTPAGKILEKLDIAAEGLERVGGLVAQWRDRKPGDEFKLKDAWSAGSLFYDVAQLPHVAYDEEGNAIGLRIDSDLPGAYAVTEARKLIEQGKTVAEVKDILYGNLGALALRSQLQDTWGHVLADPFNWALGAVKPVERLHAIRNLAMTGKVDVQYMRGLVKAAELANDTETVATLTKAIARAEESGRALNRVDRFAIAMTGGIPWMDESADASKLSKVVHKIAGSRVNPFALTPQAKASELLDVVSANVTGYLITPNWNKDPAEFISRVASAARGSIGGEWGHLASTIQGRTVQGFLAQSDAAVKAIGKEWDTYSGERRLLEIMNTVLPGTDERRLWQLAKDNPALFMKRAVEAAERPGGELIAKMIADGALTPKTVEGIGKIVGDIPLMKEEFYLKAMVTVQDAAMRQSIVQFGIKEKGLITKWADFLKAAETLPFIKANPANMIRNVVNNDVTLIGRGLFGTMLPGQIDNFWKGKFIPPQLKRAFAFAGEGEFDAGVATKALIETLEGKGDTLPQKLKAAVQKIQLGPRVGKSQDPLLDFSAKSQRFEARASIRASTMGWMEFHRKYWNAKTGFTSISKSLDPAVLDEMERVVPGITQTLDEVAESAGTDAEKFAQLMQSNIEHNTATIFKNAEDTLGYKLGDVLGDEVLGRIQEGLPDAIQKGQVKTFINQVRQEMEAHVDEMFNKHIENLPGIVAAQVQAGGPLQYHRIFGKALDEFWGGNTEHAMRMSTINSLVDQARTAKDWTKVNSLWEKILSDSENHFNRVWKKFNAYQEGMEKGATAAGLKYPKEVSSSFKDMERGWREFFDFRNSEYQKFFASKPEGQDFARGIRQLQAQIDGRFDEMVGSEDELFQRIDDMMVEQLPDKTMQDIYRNYRDQASNLRMADREFTKKFYRDVRGAEGNTQDLWSQYWAERGSRLEQMRQIEVRGSAAMQGDNASMNLFAGQQPGGEPQNIFELANQFGVSSATKTGARTDRRVLNTVNKYLEEGQEKFAKAEDIPMDVAQKAFEARAAQKAARAAEQGFIPDAEKLFPDPMPIETAISELNYGRGYAAIDTLIEEASAQTSKKSRLLTELPEEMQQKVMNWTRQVEDEMSSFRSAGVQYAAFRRDSALLNYNRRTNFDNWLGHMAPFAFWTTHSAFNWAVHSLDRPAMLTSYFRARQFFETAGLPDQNVPTRLKGHIRVNLPFTPEWMGDTFVNPMRFLLPFDSWISPWEQAQTSKFTDEKKAVSTLEKMMESGQITEDQFRQATESKTGDVWESALQQVKEGGDSYDAMDFVSMTMTPHAPLMWAYNAMRGKKNEIGPFTPMSRTVKNVATMMGVDDWSNSPYNVEGRLRKSMGLPAFDRWDDYRVGREISNIAADGKYDMTKIQEAMQVAALVEAGKMESAEAVKNNEIYALATKRANQEYAGGWAGTVLGVFGIPVKSFPEGEEKQRAIAEKFSSAMDAYSKGNVEALTKFFDAYPEYESRLALFKSPDERLKSFMVDNIWAKWNDLPKVNQDEIKEQLGSNFSDNFINKETRNYEALSPLQLQIYLKLMGGKPVGTLTADQEALVELNQLQLTDPSTAWRVQTFYDMRKEEHKEWYTLQNKYYALNTSLQKQRFLRDNPELKAYWDDRREWMNANPDLVRFLTDDEKQLKKYERMRRNAEIAVPTAQELKASLSQPTQELIADWSQGQTLPPTIEAHLERLASEYGLNLRQMMGILGYQ